MPSITPSPFQSAHSGPPKKCSSGEIIFQGPKKATTSGGSSSGSSNCTETASTSATSSCYGETDSGVDFEDMSDKISEGEGDSAEDNANEESEDDGDDGADKNKIGGEKEPNNGDSTCNGEDGRGMLKENVTLYHIYIVLL